MKFPSEVILGSSVLRKISQVDGEEFYLVGGCVRDLILGKPLLDVDILLRKQSRTFVKNVSLIFPPTKELFWNRFLTSKIESPRLVLDFARARVEEYEKYGKLPKVEPCYSIEKDLKRRDFTINSMALELWPRSYRLIDPLGGYEDLKRRILRVNKRDSFLDDPTRAFRAVKYRVRFNLTYDKTTEEEFERVKISMPEISFQRIKNEIRRIIVEEKRYDMLREVHERKLLLYWNKSFAHFNAELLERLCAILPYKEDYWHFFLIPFGLEVFFEGHKDEFTRKERRELGVVFEQSPSGELKFSKLFRIFQNVDEDTVRVWALYWRVDLNFIEEYLKVVSGTRPKVTLRELIVDLGDPQKARKVYMELYSAILDGKLKPGEEGKFLQRILKGFS